jgi:hypothetical protein
MLVHPLPIDVRQRRDRTRRACELADILRCEEHARVSAASAFVYVHELLLHVGQLGQPLQFEAGQPIGRLPQRLLCGSGIGGSLLRLLHLQVALDFQLAQIANERTGFTSESIGFPLQGTDAIRDALCGSVRGRGSLCCKRSRQRHGGNRHRQSTEKRRR